MIKRTVQFNFEITETDAKALPYLLNFLGNTYPYIFLYRDSTSNEHGMYAVYATTLPTSKGIKTEKYVIGAVYHPDTGKYSFHS